MLGIKTYGYNFNNFKAVKWVLRFVMTVFTAVLSFKRMLTTSVDDVSTTWWNFTLFIYSDIEARAFRCIQNHAGQCKL